MYFRVLLIAGALLFASAPLPANAVETAVEVPALALQGNGPKQPAEGGGVSNDNGAEADAAQPEAVYVNACIPRSGATRVINLTARGPSNILYRVVPSRFFDVTLRVVYYGRCRGSFFRDQRFAGGTESVLVRSPAGACPVRITIGGYRGSTGCFNFSATP